MSWKTRLLEERDEVEARGIKLFEFIESEAFEALESWERCALCMQLAHMQGYARILDERIKSYAIVDALALVENSNSQKSAEADS